MTGPGPIDAAGLAVVRRAIEDVADPELPVLTLGDLGIVRDVRRDDDTGGAGADGAGNDGERGFARVVVDLTPTYSGCPATEVIAADVVAAAAALGTRARVRTVLSPAWTTDWMSEAGRRKLRQYGIAPPGPVGATPGPVALTLGATALLTTPARPACPRCGDTEPAEVSRFGATSCQSLWRCTACAEPFSHVKAI